jgi:hypothetical protein
MPIRKPSVPPPVPPTPEQRARVHDLLAGSKAERAEAPRAGSGPTEEESMAQADRGSFWQEVGSGLRRLLGSHWAAEDRAFGVLLDVLVRGKKLKDDVVTAEADAPAVSTRDPRAEEAHLVQQELATARADLPDFERALIDAWQRSGGTGREVAYRTTDPAEDRAADLLIRYLVTTDMATVRSDETGSEQYTYYLAVDWDTLIALTEHLDAPLRPALESAGRG